MKKDDDYLFRFASEHLGHALYTLMGARKKTQKDDLHHALNDLEKALDDLHDRGGFKELPKQPAALYRRLRAHLNKRSGDWEKEHATRGFIGKLMKEVFGLYVWVQAQHEEERRG